jgi:molybdopterin-containing oxidoreductase family membrane subunit
MPQLTYASIDQTVLNTLTPPKKYYWVIVVLLFLGVLVGAACWGYQIFVGIGAGGQNNPVAWGTYLINFVFWVGMSSGWELPIQGP